MCKTSIKANSEEDGHAQRGVGSRLWLTHGPPTDPKAEMLKTLALYPRVTQCLTALYTGPMCIETVPGHFLFIFKLKPQFGEKGGKGESTEEEQGINLK